MYMVITGTSRGIGLELTRLALQDGHQVMAVARIPEESSGLQALKATYKDHLSLLKVDLADEASHEKIARSVEDWPAVDVLINNAGIYREDEALQDFAESFLINATKPFFIARALKRKLQEAKRPLSLQITSQMGSIEDNHSGGAYSYRASKAALNMLFKSFSVDESWLISLLVHPGWVQTRMGGKNAPTSVEESAEGIWMLVKKADASYNGAYRDFRGKNLPW